MTDPRLARLAELIAGYSLELQPGKVLRIDTPAVGRSARDRALPRRAARRRASRT